jgi:hypothetical protein
MPDIWAASYEGNNIHHDFDDWPVSVGQWVCYSADKRRDLVSGARPENSREEPIPGLFGMAKSFRRILACGVHG